MCAMNPMDRTPALTLRDRATAELTEPERRDLAAILAQAVDPLTSAVDVVSRYVERVRRVMIAYADALPIACQFYQLLDDVPDAPPVLHFSLAARRRDCQARGLNARMSRPVFLRAAARKGPFSPIVVAARIENPIPYRNLLRLGGRVFPDVSAPVRPNPAPGLYRRIAKRLGIVGLDEQTGLLPFRSEVVGFSHAQDAYSPGHGDPVSRAFLAYLRENAPAPGPHSVFAVTVTSLARASAAILGEAARRRLCHERKGTP